MGQRETFDLVRAIALMFGRIAVAGIQGYLLCKDRDVALDFTSTGSEAVQAFREDTE